MALGLAPFKDAVAFVDWLSRCERKLRALGDIFRRVLQQILSVRHLRRYAYPILDEFVLGVPYALCRLLCTVFLG